MSTEATITPETTAAVDAAITSRRSIRAFLPTPVPRQTIEDILAVAARAPSGTNTQPWQVHVLTGGSKVALSRDIRAAFDDPEERARHTEPYAYYPTEWRSPYIDRRRKVGWDLYALLGIGKSDKQRMHEQHGRNYQFFDAPVGLMFTIGARARGLHTCPQAAFTQFHRIIGRHLSLAESQMVVCGMSLGHADWAAVENTLVTEREPVAGFTHYHD